MSGCLFARSVKCMRMELRLSMVCHCMQQTLTTLIRVTGGSQKSTIAHLTCSTKMARLA